MANINSSDDYADIAHKAANETLSISIGVQVLSSLRLDLLTPAQQRALKHLEESSARLVDLIEIMKGADPHLMES